MGPHQGKFHNQQVPNVLLGGDNDYEYGCTVDSHYHCQYHILMSNHILLSLKDKIPRGVPLIAINILLTSLVVQMTNCNLGNELF